MDVKSRLEGKLPQVKAQLSLWESCVEKGRSNLSSISNLINQLEVLEKGKLGVVGRHQHIHHSLQVKIMDSMEDSVKRVLEQKIDYRFYCSSSSSKM